MKFFVKSVVFILAVITFCLVLLSRFVPYPISMIESLSIGILIALLFVTTGFFSFIFATKLKQKGFTLLVISTIAGRMILLLTVLFLLIRLSYFDIKIITVATLGSYFIFQIIEIIGFTKINAKES